MGIGSTTCGGHFECWGPLLYGSMGAVIGGAVGMPLGASFSAKKYGARPGQVLLHMGITAGASITVLSVGSLVYSPVLTGIGAVGLGLGTPFAAGATVAHQLRATADSPALTVRPMLQRRRHGLVASMRF